jgi:hypothetical protein
MSELKVTINGDLYPHMIYHFVLTYSNRESGTVCASESFASLTEGLENALWELGGVPHLGGLIVRRFLIANPDKVRNVPRATKTPPIPTITIILRHQSLCGVAGDTLTVTGAVPFGIVGGNWSKPEGEEDQQL